VPVHSAISALFLEVCVVYSRFLLCLHQLTYRSYSAVEITRTRQQLSSRSLSSKLSVVILTQPTSYIKILSKYRRQKGELSEEHYLTIYLSNAPGCSAFLFSTSNKKQECIALCRRIEMHKASVTKKKKSKSSSTCCDYVSIFDALACFLEIYSTVFSHTILHHWEEWWIHQKAALPFSETWTGWRVGQRGT